MITKKAQLLCEFEKKIGYKFNNEHYLQKALTHSSYNREINTKHEDNERLEFLGDAFLDAIVSEELFNRMDKVSEGRLTKTRALIVCEKSLAAIAHELQLGHYMNMGHGEDSTGGREKDSILADGVEAVIGAIYLDGGFDSAKKVVLTMLEKTIELAIEGKIFLDYKSEVQEILQGKGKVVSISYITDREEGPAHDKTFYIHMECDGVVIGRGKGKNKKMAEQNAAKEALAILERRNG